MRTQPWTRIGIASALLVALGVSTDALSQLGKGGGGGRAAGHREPSKPKQANHGPAMARPDGANRPAPRPAAPKGGGAPKVAAGKDRPGAGGPGSANKAGGSFQRPGADRGPDPKGPATVAKRPGGTERPGGGASSAQLNDFLGGGGRPGAPGPAKDGRPGPGKDGRPDIGKDDRPKIGKDDRPITGKDDRPKIGKDDRPIIGKDDRPKTGKDIRPDVNIKGDVNIGGGNTVNIAQNKQAWVDNRHATGNQVRANAGNRYASAYTSGAYRKGVVGGYPYTGGWGTRDPYHGWRPASYAAVGAFVGAAAAPEPVYYGYGAGGNVYYEDNAVYVNGQAAGTPEQYAQQVTALVSAAPAKVTDTDWLPLGVFAFTREDVSDSQGMIELAINKQGVLAGTYYNETTGASRPLKGTLDQKSQRVAIGFADGKNADVVLEAGVYNLTQEEAPGLLHFGTTESTPVLLVRLQPPAENPGGK